MKTIKNIHSVVDLITNSSTVIYTQATDGTIKTVKEIINLIKKLGNSELTADDLFTFSLKKDEEYNDYDDDYYYDNYETVELVITPKDGVEAPLNLGSKLDTMFYREASYDG